MCHTSALCKILEKIGVIVSLQDLYFDMAFQLYGHCRSRAVDSAL